MSRSENVEAQFRNNGLTLRARNRSVQDVVPALSVRRTRLPPRRQPRKLPPVRSSSGYEAFIASFGGEQGRHGRPSTPRRHRADRAADQAAQHVRGPSLPGRTPSLISMSEERTSATTRICHVRHRRGCPLGPAAPKTVALATHFLQYEASPWEKPRRFVHVGLSHDEAPDVPGWHPYQRLCP